VRGGLRAVAARLATGRGRRPGEVAHRDDWTRPEIDDSAELVLEDARHPVVERLAAAGRFVPNDVSLGRRRGAGRGLWLVTGPNMAGKSTLMPPDGASLSFLAPRWVLRPRPARGGSAWSIAF